MLFTTEKLSNMLLDASASSNMLFNTKASSNINKLSNMLLDALASSNMLLDYEAPSNILLLQSFHETLQSPLSILHMRLGNINKSNNMLLDASASNNMLLDYEAPSNISLLQSSHETLQSSSYTASILHMHLDNINKSSNMLLDAEASSNMLLDYEASNDILLDALASYNILLLQLSHKTLQSSSSPTDATLILHMHRQGKMNASIQIAKTLWNKGNYISRYIRTWDDLYIKSGELLSYYQGKHKKSIKGYQEWLHQQSSKSHFPRALKIYIEKILLPKIEHTKDKISEKTYQTYMHALGYKYNKRNKDVYYDGHKWPDVVLYRKRWLERMFKYKKNMKDFTGNMLEVIVEPELEYGKKKLVQVIHDEYHFYTNDKQCRIWTREDENILRSKHMEHS
ncbi:31373_t:CDS:2, partial [Gigaspora margarita]